MNMAINTFFSSKKTGFRGWTCINRSDVHRSGSETQGLTAEKKHFQTRQRNRLVSPLWILEPNVEMISPSPEKHLYQVIQVIHMLKYFRIGDDFLGQIWDPSPQIMV